MLFNINKIMVELNQPIELHVTVKEIPSHLLQAKLGIKIKKIVLDKGTNRNQFVCCRVFNNFKEIGVIERIVTSLNNDSKVLRVKLKTTKYHPLLEGLPNSYHEHHIELGKCPLYTVDYFTNFLKSYPVAYSESYDFPFFEPVGRFMINQRLSMSDKEAKDSLYQVLDELKKHHILIVNTIREYNFYDDNPDLDEGWF